MCAESQLEPLVASVRNEKHRVRKLLLECSEAISYLLKRYATDQAIAAYDATFLRCMQKFNTTLQQYADGLIETSCRVADVHNKNT